MVSMVKAIILDLDRTLLRNDKSVSEFTLDTLAECKNKGILLVAATARPGRAIQVYDEIIGFDAAITLNGAVTAIHDDEKRIFINRSDIEGVLGELNSLGDCVISLESTQGICSNVDIPEWNPQICENLLTAPVLDEVYKIIVSSGKHDLASLLPDFLSENVYYSIANNDLYQIMSNKATKWNGIKSILSDFGIDTKEAIVFGDDFDDIEAIRKCGTGVAVSNAIAEVKDAADAITDSNEEDGVAKYLNKEILYGVIKKR